MAQDTSEQGYDRLLTFVDAIVAIAVTLLVLPLVELTAEIEDYASIGALVEHNQGEFWAFLLSFVVVSRFWFAQHRTARHLRRYDRTVAGLIMAWALTIVFLPFPTALLAEAGDETATKVLYIGTLAATMTLLTVLVWHLRLHPGLVDDTDELDPVDGAANVVMLLLALAISIAVPAASYTPLLLLLAAEPAARAYREIRRRRAPTAARRARPPRRPR